MKTIREMIKLAEAKKKMKGEDPCWDNYEMVGTKKKNGKEVPNCVPKNEAVEDVAEGSMNEFYDKKAHKPEGGKLDRLVRDALAKKVPVFAHIGGVRSGYVKSEDPVKGFLVIGSGRNKNYVTFDDQAQKATMDAGRVYIQPRSEWNASREIEEILPEEVETAASRKAAPGWHSDSVKNPNFNDELSGRRVSPPGRRLKSGKLSADERGSQERIKALMKFKREKGGLTGPKGPLPEEVEQGVAEETIHVGYRNSKGVWIKTSTHSNYPAAEKAMDELEKQGKKGVQHRYDNKGNIDPGTHNFRKIDEQGVAEATENLPGQRTHEEVETAAQVLKHFEKGQATPSGVPKWVAEPLKKKKKKSMEEAGDPELMGGAVSKPTASGNNPKLADKFMKAFRKMKSPANISCKTVGMTSTCESKVDVISNILEAAKKKKMKDDNGDTDVKSGKPVGSKQEPININPELKVDLSRGR